MRLYGRDAARASELKDSNRAPCQQVRSACRGLDRSRTRRWRALRRNDRRDAVPKLGMGPVRREQICRAAAPVISREGFAGTTMRMVAEEAGVSTGMLNHYFTNRQDLLEQALVFVSERAQARMREAIADVPPGRELLSALASIPPPPN